MTCNWRGRNPNPPYELPREEIPSLVGVSVPWEFSMLNSYMESCRRTLSVRTIWFCSEASRFELKGPGRY